MKKIIILLGKNGDIAMVANHYIKHFHPQPQKPVWVVSDKFAPILEELYGEFFDIDPMDIDPNQPLQALIICKRKYASCQIGLIQQNGADENMDETRKYRTFQDYQIGKLNELFGASIPEKTTPFKIQKPRVLNVYLGGESARIAEPELILQNIKTVASSQGFCVIDHTRAINRIRGFEKLGDYILNNEGTWICNDTLPLHLFGDGFPHPYIQISRDYEWACAKPGPNCVGVFTQTMIEAPQGLLELSAALHSGPISVLPGYKTWHVVSEHPGRDNDTIARYGMAANSWIDIAKNDIHYAFHFFESEGLPYVWDIFEGIDSAAGEGDLCIFTNRDICFVPEATAIIRSFMTNRKINMAFNSRVDIITNKNYGHRDLYPGFQYSGIDMFCWLKGTLPNPHPALKQLVIGRESWDIAFAHFFGGATNRIPYNITYHMVHQSPWQTTEGNKGNWHNNLLIGLINKDMNIGIAEKKFAYYETV